MAAHNEYHSTLRAARAVVRESIGGRQLYGCAHDYIQAPTAGAPAGRLGVLFLNFGQQPRSWRGDLAVQIADRLAVEGFPCFRFDMPGLGDTPGDLPQYLEQLYRSLQEGAHVPSGQELCRRLLSRYSLNGLVLSGFCGGAVTAVRTAAALRSQVRGLVLFEPEFALTQLPSNGEVARASEGELMEGVNRAKSQLRNVQAWKRLFNGEVDLEHYLRLARDMTRVRIERYIRGGEPPLAPEGVAVPADANRPMLEAWRSLMARGVPMLVQTAATPQRRKLDAQYVEWTLIGRAGGPDWIEHEGSNHVLLTNGSRQRAIEGVSDWFKKRFPQQCRANSGCQAPERLEARSA